MSRVITVNHCADCPHNDVFFTDAKFDVDWCKLAKKEVYIEMGHSFPAWCPLPESKEESK